MVKGVAFEGAGGCERCLILSSISPVLILMLRILGVLAVLTVGCSENARTLPTTPRDVVLRGVTRLPEGDVVDVEIAGGRIAHVTPSTDTSGHFVVSGFIDSHVHLAYAPRALEMAEHGIAAAIDLGAPEDFLTADHAPLHVLAAGPMLTSPGGYPLDSWGARGYGLGVSDPDTARAAVTRLVAEGAAVIKVPIASDARLDDTTLAAIVAEAHARGRKVAVHALSDADALRAARAGVDVLAHTPVQLLATATLDAWAGRAVISTLGAFGGGADTVANLRALRARGVTVLYGTDFGNTATAGIDGRELALLCAAGLEGAAILAAGTATPAAFWGVDADLGDVSEGRAASVLVLADDPRTTPATLTSPLAVWLDGVRIAGTL